MAKKTFLLPTHWLEYVDRQGKRSQRKIAITESYLFNKSDYVTAYCFLRQQERTFRVANIILLTDLQTGEVVIDNPKAGFTQKETVLQITTPDYKMSKNRLDKLAEKLDKTGNALSKTGDGFNKAGNSFMKAGCGLLILICIIVLLFAKAC